LRFLKPWTLRRKKSNSLMEENGMRVISLLSSFPADLRPRHHEILIETMPKGRATANKCAPKPNQQDSYTKRINAASAISSVKSYRRRFLTSIWASDCKSRISLWM
jgi:hypothetical protein